MEYEETTFVRDAAKAVFDDDAPGITVDDEGEPSFDWGEVERVTIENPPHADAFEAKEFYKLPATVARPIAQRYGYGDTEVTLKKPREELKKAAWSLDNAPWTMGHPETTMVKDVDDIRGFWRDPRYLDSLDDLDANLHIPTDDEEAKEFIEENSDVSVGFYSKNVRVEDYDGVVGDADDPSELDGYQVSMYFDHCASVGRGRCPGEKGCGIDAANDHGHLSFISGTAITHKGRKGVDGMELDDSKFVNPDDDKWYAVPPSDNPDDEWKFPINNCSDVQDAWKLRNHGDLSIDVSTLESRIKSRAGDLDCEVPGDGDEDALGEDLELHGDSWYTELKDTASDSTDCGCNTPNDNETFMTEFDIDVEDLSTEAVLAHVADQHEGVEARLEELRAYKDKAEAAQEAAEELDLDGVSSLAKKVALLTDELEDLRGFRDEHETDEMKEHAEVIAERTDRFGEDAEEVLEEHEDLDDIKETRELVEELTKDTEEQTANPGTDNESGTDYGGKYVASPWE